MLIPGALFFIIFKYIPMYGVVMAFQNFRMARGFLRSEFIGFANFQKVFGSAFFPVVMWNTVLISLYKIIIGFPFPIILALLMNEIGVRWFKKTMQTVMYMPHFISWIVVSSLVNTFFSSTSGVLAQITGQTIDWLVDPNDFRAVLVLSDIWKNAGWGTIVYMAALSGINMDLYEAASIDGATGFKKFRYITIPMLTPTTFFVVIMMTIQCFKVFDLIYVMTGGGPGRSTNVLVNHIYNAAFVDFKFGYASASAVVLFLIVLVVTLIQFRGEKKFTDYI